MANTTSARKAARKIARRTEVNKARRSRMRSAVRKVEEAIASGHITAEEYDRIVDPAAMTRPAPPPTPLRREGGGTRRRAGADGDGLAGLGPAEGVAGRPARRSHAARGSQASAIAARSAHCP